jgi:hypothetical protein
MRYSHLKLSNAFATSNLTNSIGVFERWKCLMAPWTYWKLSWMLQGALTVRDDSVQVWSKPIG